MKLEIYSLKKILEEYYIAEIKKEHNIDESKINYENSSKIYVNEVLLTKKQLKKIKTNAESVVNLWFATDFKCTLNPDVEYFLHKKSIELQRKNASRTFLILDEELNIHAYFTLAIHMFSNELKDENKEAFLSNEKLKRLKSYDIYYCDKGEPDDDIEPDKKVFWSILIGQLGRNDNSTKDIIDLKLLLKFIFSKIEEIKELIGGNIVLLEAVKNEKLIAKYVEYNFEFLQELEEHYQLFVWNETY